MGRPALVKRLGSGDFPAGTGVGYIGALPTHRPTVEDCPHPTRQNLRMRAENFKLGANKVSPPLNHGRTGLKRTQHVSYSRPLDLDKVVQLFMCHNPRRIVAPNLHLDKDEEDASLRRSISRNLETSPLHISIQPHVPPSLSPILELNKQV